METRKHPTIANGKVCYIEIPAVDVLLSASFYKKVFGWQIRERSNGQIAFGSVTLPAISSDYIRSL